MTAPPAGAGPLNVRMACVVTPPGSVETSSARSTSAAGKMASAAARVSPPDVAEITTGVTAATLRVVTSKVADIAAAATVTLAGTVAAGLSLASVTTLPPAGAGSLRRTVPSDDVLPVTAPGARTTPVSGAADHGPPPDVHTTDRPRTGPGAA